MSVYRASASPTGAVAPSSSLVSHPTNKRLRSREGQMNGAGPNTWLRLATLITVVAVLGIRVFAAFEWTAHLPSDPRSEHDSSTYPVLQQGHADCCQALDAPGQPESAAEDTCEGDSESHCCGPNCVGTPPSRLRLAHFRLAIPSVEPRLSILDEPRFSHYRPPRVLG